MRTKIITFLIALLLAPVAQASAGHEVNIDGHIIVVAQAGGNQWTARGGEDARDGRFIPYRKERAIELVSRCRIGERLSNPTDETLVARVRCG